MDQPLCELVLGIFFIVLALLRQHDALAAERVQTLVAPAQAAQRFVEPMTRGSALGNVIGMLTHAEAEGTQRKRMSLNSV